MLTSVFSSCELKKLYGEQLEKRCLEKKIMNEWPICPVCTSWQFITPLFLVVYHTYGELVVCEEQSSQILREGQHPMQRKVRKTGCTERQIEGGLIPVVSIGKDRGGQKTFKIHVTIPRKILLPPIFFPFVTQNLHVFFRISL
jgi:hypothetical protein